MPRYLGRFAALFVVMVAVVPVFAGSPRIPYPQNVSYLSGSLVPRQRPLDQLNREVAAAYRQWKDSYLFVNLGDSDCAVRVTLRSDEGGSLGIALNRSVPAGEWYQLNDVFTVAGVSAADLATATVEVTTPGGRVWAYGSAVDNGNGDPTTIPVVIVTP